MDDQHLAALGCRQPWAVGDSLDLDRGRRYDALAVTPHAEAMSR